jgi:thiol-disulfide isomerase/thioredoxin
MHRLLAGVMVLALAGLLARAEDKPAKDKGAKDKESKKAGDFKSLIEKVQEEAKEQGADKDRSKLKKVLQKHLPEFLEFARANPKDENALTALMVCVRWGPEKGGKEGVRAKAVNAIAKDHAKNSKLLGVLSEFSGLGEEGDPVLKAVIQENADKKTQARAAKALIGGREQLVQVATEVKKNEKFRDYVKKEKGDDYVKDLEANAGRYKKDADQFRKKYAKYADLVPMVGYPLPKVTSVDLDGKKVQVGDYKGKVVVIDVWATWCPPCKAMIPHERGLVKRLKGKPFVLVSVSADAKKETVTDFLKDTEMPWTHWWNGAKGGVIDAWDIQFFPTIFVLDGKGVIRYEGVRGEAMDKAVDTLLKEMGVKVGKEEEPKEGKKEEKKESK